ncbi:MAG: ABC transporter permease [Bacteroidales bacterium]|nr:ABC transporter permease [Bacteroidales bacterium]
MKKIKLIIYREYITRIRKKSFIVMSLLGPILMAALFVVPVWVTSLEDEEDKLIAVVDSSHLFRQLLPETEKIHFLYLENYSLEKAEKEMTKNHYYAVLYIPSSILSSPIVTLSSPKQPSLSLRMHIISSLKSQIESFKLIKKNIDPEVIQSVKTDVKVGVVKLNDDGTREEKSSDMQMILGFIGGLLIYMFIFMYGAQVMRGVIEEKTNRIVEVIISSVKPFQLMMGKIIGIAMVGLTQFIIWGILTFTLISIASSLIVKDKDIFKQQVQSVSIMNKANNNNSNIHADFSEDEVSAIFKSLNQIDFGVMIGSFLFFFIFGYLMYSALFAAIGGAVDNEADTQQFMLPITIPLILSIVMMSNITTNLEGPIAFWFSIIPLTSPVVMMMRIPFGVPWSEAILSGTLLIVTFIFTTWLAGKIYKTGILLYGKKVTYKDLYKWIKMNN